MIAGGYGSVGREAAGMLAAALPGRVTIAGRDLDRARACAVTVGHGAEARRLDVTDPGDALDDAALVLMCAEPPDTGLASRCLSRGVHYVDVTADAARLAALEGLDSAAREGGAAAVLSVGLAPGVTNLLAALLVRGLPAPPERLDVLVLVGIGEDHGRAAIEWTLDELASESAFASRTRFRVPGRRRPVHAFSFGFPEARTLPATLGVGRTATWFGLDPPGATMILAAAVRLGAARALGAGRARRAAIGALEAGALGPDTCVVAARADGRQATLTGRRQARLTGLVAAEVSRQLLEGAPRPGVHHIEDLFEPRDVLERLAATEPSVRLHL